FTLLRVTPWLSALKLQHYISTNGTTDTSQHLPFLLNTSLHDNPDFSFNVFAAQLRQRSALQPNGESNLAFDAASKSVSKCCTTI
ncbi:MAG TPA: hypothetical protein VEY71_11715, partial [Chitinophagales bacterium]|nr:hypothetical protein [Chitinophagales bacterium]